MYLEAAMMSNVLLKKLIEEEKLIAYADDLILIG